MQTETIYVIDDDDVTYDYDGGWLKVKLPAHVGELVMAIWEDNDPAECEAQAHSTEDSRLVGWWLHEDYYTGAASQRMAYLAIIDDGEHAFPICEACHYKLSHRVAAPA